MLSESPHRSLFPSASRRIHLDHAGVAPISQRVVEAIERFAHESAETLADRYPYWNARAEVVRAACARLAGASSRQVAFVKNTSEALSFVAGGLDWRAGDIVVTVDQEFPSNVYPWRALDRLGVETRALSPEAIARDPEAVRAALAGRVRALALSAVAYATGDRPPLADIAALCREQDVLVVVDAIQALGAVDVSLSRDGLDCVAADGHKWICAPEGTGFMAVSDRLLDRLRPIELGWKSVLQPDRYYPYEFHVRHDAAKLEAGSLNLLGVHALGAAVDLALEVGVAKIEDRLANLTGELEEGLRSRGRELLGERGRDARIGRSVSGIVCFRPQGTPERVRQELWARGVVCKVRLGGLRVAPHHYQDGRDVEAFFERLDEAEDAVR
ncbi:MAG: aminotransferase class V-fold PLP-dependent enzyme [Deltaproteobacteria bacterium]|nr:aminotransferase class V-fold PLP-dependent enzyme [Deltaproteobacteria bacterium]